MRSLRLGRGLILAAAAILATQPTYALQSGSQYHVFNQGRLVGPAPKIGVPGASTEAQRIAYYRAEAERLTEEQCKHEEMGAAYQKENRLGKYQTAVMFCKNSASLYAQAAKGASSLADLYEGMAKESPK